MTQITRYILILLLCAGGLISCKKDKVPEPVELTKWERISGTYKVYDTTGVYLYEMSIEHILGTNQNGSTFDSLRFNNFDGQFIFGERQSQSTSVPQYYISIGFHEQMVDTNLNRWKINQNGDLAYNNFYNDTIKLRFTRHNLNYYMEDMTPYQNLKIKQIAVKKH